jgi:hypothetical protein
MPLQVSSQDQLTSHHPGALSTRALDRSSAVGMPGKGERMGNDKI